MNPKSVRSKYDFFVGLLRDDYQDRGSGRDLILNSANLLGSSRATVESNVQFLHSAGIDIGKNRLLLGTTMNKKREKMAWALREVFHYRETSPEKKRELFPSLNNMIRDHPELLAYSITSLEKRKDALRERAVEYAR